MYDMQIKRKLFLFAMRECHIDMEARQVLDVGFGSGDILFSFPSSCKIRGVDFSADAVRAGTIRAARKGYGDADFFAIDLDTSPIPFGDAEFDIIICSHVLEHLADDRAMLEQLHRLLIPSGSAIILIPVNEAPGDDPHHVRQYTQESFTARAREAGFQLRFHFEGEYMWHVIGGFFLHRYHKRIPLLGPLVSAMINIPLAVLPFRIHIWIDRMFARAGYLPRQAVFCLSKA